MYKRQGIVRTEEIIYNYCLPLAENVVRQTGRYKCNTTKYSRDTAAVVQWMNGEGDVGKPSKKGMTFELEIEGPVGLEQLEVGKRVGKRGSRRRLLDGECMAQLGDGTV